MDTEFDPRDVHAWTVHLGGPPPQDLPAALGAGSIHELLAALPSRSGGRLRVGDRTATFAELVSEVGRVAAGLDALCPTTRSEATLVVLESSMEFVVVYLAVVSQGGAVLLANPTSTASEIEAMVGAAEPSVAIVDPVAAQKLQGLGLKPILVSSLLSHGSEAARAVSAPDDVAIIGFTSGTTGRPKAVPLRHRHLLASIRGATLAWQIDETDHIVHALPLFHQHGLSAIHAMLTTGCSVTIATSFSVDLLDLASEVDATILFAVPAMYRRLVTDRRFSADSLPKLRLAVSGSAPLPAELYDLIEERLKAAPLERYGTTETGLDISNPLRGKRMAGTIGLPLPGVELRIRDERGHDVDEGAVGEICLRGAQVFDGYRGDLSSDSWWEGNWFRTGDLGIRASDGVVRIVGRLKELIVSGGMNVYPSEVERALAEHPLVLDVAVVGHPSERWGEEVVAHVVTRSEIDAAELIAFCRESLASYKCPKDVVRVHEIPRTHLGKVKRNLLQYAPAPGGANPANI